MVRGDCPIDALTFEKTIINTPSTDYRHCGSACTALLRLLGAVVQDFIGPPHKFQIREGKRYGYYRQ